MKVRLFIAIEMADEVRRALGRLQGRMKKSIRGVRWVKPGSIHLTLAFLGNTEEGLVPELRRLLDGVAKRHRPFTLVIRDVGAFPSLRRPRVLWCGVRKGGDECRSLAEQIAEGLSRLGLPQERREFRPHLTLARVKVASTAREAAALARFRDTEIGTMRVSSISLIRSTLTSEGPLYKTLHTAVLRQEKGK